MPELSVRFQGPVGDLEGKLSMKPPPEAGSAVGAVVFAHPYPLLGGTMDHAVVRLGCHALNQLGFATLRFNFRGVGHSAGRFDHARGERDDLLAAIDFARRTWARLPLFLAGYSFGARMGWAVLPEAAERGVRAFVGVAMPMNFIAFQPLVPLPVPTLHIVGDADPYCPVTMAEDFQRQQAGSAFDTRILSGTDHALARREAEIAGLINDFFRGRLAASAAP